MCYTFMLCVKGLRYVTGAGHLGASPRTGWPGESQTARAAHHYIYTHIYVRYINISLSLACFLILYVYVCMMGHICHPVVVDRDWCGPLFDICLPEPPISQYNQYTFSIFINQLVAFRGICMHNNRLNVALCYNYRRIS